MTNQKLTDKAVRALDLAISAHLIGSEQEAATAALTCGRLAARAGWTLDQVWPEVVGQPAESFLWYYIVDGHAEGVIV